MMRFWQMLCPNKSCASVNIITQLRCSTCSTNLHKKPKKENERNKKRKVKRNSRNGGWLPVKKEYSTKRRIIDDESDVRRR